MRGRHDGRMTVIMLMVNFKVQSLRQAMFLDVTPYVSVSGTFDPSPPPLWPTLYEYEGKFLYQQFLQGGKGVVAFTFYHLTANVILR